MSVVLDLVIKMIHPTLSVTIESVCVPRKTIPDNLLITSSSKRYYTPNVVSHDCVSMCTEEDHSSVIITGGRPFLIITSLQHSTNSEWVGVLVNTVCPLSRHQHYLLERDPQECFHNLQPTTGSVLPMQPLLEAKSFCHSPSGHRFLTALPRNGSDEDHTMLVVILCTLLQSFPYQLGLFQCWGPCGILH